MTNSNSNIIRITDNNYIGVRVSETHKENIAAIANKTLPELAKEHKNLLIFPPNWDTHKDDIGKSTICSFDNNNLRTANFMGFVSRNKTQLVISSRFYPENNDFFLHYLLQKVFKINILNFDISHSKENIWDFMLYLFPYFLKKAYAQGLYKTYQKKAYNDANVKGSIDINRHIRQNMPFAGKIAYNTREHSHDNYLTQLVRHCIEYIKTRPLGTVVLNNDSETREIVSKFIFATQNTYSKNARQQIIAANIKPISHPYFTEYTMLQKICLKILRQERLTYGEENDTIAGLVFDGAWLWEEYLNTFLKIDDKKLIHAENKTRKNPFYLFEGKQGRIYPDFYVENEIVLDAKYKRLIKQDEKEKLNVSREDKYQLISYLHVLKAKKAGFIFPKEDESYATQLGILNGYGGELYCYGLKIKSGCNNFSDFKQQMEEAETVLNREINNFQ